MSKFDITNINLPTNFSKKVQDSIDNNTLGNPENRLSMIRECVNYFEGRGLERPTTEQYAAISRKICDKYPALRNSHHTKYWVCLFLI